MWVEKRIGSNGDILAHKNIEIKARCSDANKIRKILKEHNANFQGLDHQIDTYFKVNNGKLKLREGNIENNLIYYARENISGPKQSDIILLPTEPNSKLKEQLTKALSILVIIDKQREIYFIDNIKFHIDLVKDLGLFVEIEARDYDDKFTKEFLLDQCNKFIKLFNIKQEDLITESYSDLLLKKI